MSVGPKSRAEISVIVPTYNGSATIIDCLRSVERAVNGRKAQIVVVDSSSDHTADLVGENFPDVHLIRSPTRLSVGAARNRGIAEAYGDLVFFTDQDCEVPIDWITRVAEHLRDPTLDGVGGAVGIRNMASSSGCALYFLEFLYHFPGRGSVEHDKPFLIGCNAAYRRRVFTTLRFPDQTLGEDVLFSHSLRSNGFRVAYDPDICVLHQNKEGWRTFFNYNYEIGQAAAAYHATLGLRRGTFFLRYPTAVFAVPLIMLPLIAARLIARGRASYVRRFLRVAPMCVLGNYCWAAGFRSSALAARRPAADASEALLSASDEADPVLRSSA